MISTYNGIPVYEATLDSEDSRMVVVSLVDSPAIEADFLAFDKQEPLQFSIVSEEQRMVLGPVMIPERLIYRETKDGTPFYIKYKAETIHQMAEKYFAENNTNNLDTDHSFNLVDGVVLTQAFFKDASKGINPVGFESLPDDTLFFQYHILDDEIWAGVKAGNWKGFSLAGNFDVVPVELQKIKESKERTMTKLNSIKAMLQHILAQFARMSTDKGLLSYFDDELAIGTDVMIVDEDGKETKAPDGEYTNEDGVKYIIADGKVSEIIEPEIESVETEMEAEEPTVEPEAVEEPAVEEPVAEEPVQESEEVAPEAVQEAAENAETEPQVDPRDEQISTLQAENEELRNRIAELEAKLNEPAAEPIEKVFDNVTRVEKTGNKKLDNLIRVLNS